MKTIYRADDGTEFDTILECQAYERRQAIGADGRFVDKLEALLQSVITTDDRGNAVINASTDDDDTYSLTPAAIIIADNLDELIELRDSIKHERTKPKTASKGKGKLRFTR